MDLITPKSHTVTFIMGVTDAGKNTQIKKILEKYPHMFIQCLSDKTRALRRGEKNGVDFHRLSVKDFLHKIKQGYFLERIQDPKTQQYYGTSAARLESALQHGHVLKELEPMGFRQLLEKSVSFPFKGIFIDVPDQVIIQRARERGDPEEELPQRIIKSQKERELIAELLTQGAPITVLNGSQSIAQVTRCIENTIMAFPDNRKRHNRE